MITDKILKKIKSKKRVGFFVPKTSKTLEPETPSIKPYREWLMIMRVTITIKLSELSEAFIIFP